MTDSLGEYKTRGKIRRPRIIRDQMRDQVPAWCDKMCARTYLRLNHSILATNRKNGLRVQFRPIVTKDQPVLRTNAAKTAVIISIECA
jgi:hypothetical protein